MCQGLCGNQAAAAVNCGFASVGVSWPPGGLANSQLAPSSSDHPVAKVQRQFVLEGSQPASSAAFSAFLRAQWNFGISPKAAQLAQVC